MCKCHGLSGFCLLFPSFLEQKLVHYRLFAIEIGPLQTFRSIACVIYSMQVFQNKEVIDAFLQLYEPNMMLIAQLLLDSQLQSDVDSCCCFLNFRWIVGKILDRMSQILQVQNQILCLFQFQLLPPLQTATLKKVIHLLDVIKEKHPKFGSL